MKNISNRTQLPVFALNSSLCDQTRAPQPAGMPQTQQEVIAADLPQLWALEFLPDGRMLVTLKEGAMRVVSPDGTAGADIAGLPNVAAEGQGGLPLCTRLQEGSAS